MKNWGRIINERKKKNQGAAWGGGRPSSRTMGNGGPPATGVV